MVDNSSVPVASGNETFANNDIAGVKYPRNKVVWGPAGTANDADVASGKALPVQVRTATGLVPIGEPTDAAATATDTTSVTAISIWKQISKTLQAMAASAAGRIYAQISDGTNSPAIKAASTAPVATDPALVVAISPNSVNANGQTTMANSAPVVIASNQSPIAAASDTSQLFNGAANVSLTPKFAAVAVSSSGDNSIVALVASKKIRVLSAKLTANGAVNAKWRSNTTDKTGLSYFAAAGDGEVLPFNPTGWFETASGEALQLNLSGAVAVGGHVSYVEV